eukprot:TRINITY_DN2473_c3_g1_i1.p1 TRINITY_DN2473_c3_g1~~TRINITY_DN2473_c3_g1_i1.p1  ORF type:complete len:331 (+),score=48.00 TRINITY_DN2473_c3_g1_i1:61-993(+)
MIKRHIILLARPIKPPWSEQAKENTTLPARPRGKVLWESEKKRSNLSRSTYKDHKGNMIAKRRNDIKWLAHFRKQRKRQDERLDEKQTTSDNRTSKSDPPPKRPYQSIFKQLISEHDEHKSLNPSLVQELVDSGHHPLNILKELTAEGVSIDDENLGTILNKLATSFADWGIEKRQSERGKLGRAVIDQIHDLCENHETGTVSASALLRCAVCVPLPLTARKIFQEIYEEGVAINTLTCEAYLRMLIAFDERPYVREDYPKIVNMGVNISQDVAQLLSRKNGPVVHHMRRKPLVKEVRKARWMEPTTRLC